MVRVLTVALISMLTVAASPSAAGAFCVGPQLEHDAASVDRDGVVRVIGAYWGDDCYDTGEPPAGEGVLGRPVSGIEIYLVQGDIEHLVATGDADEKYAFEVDLPVPDELKSGPFEVIARMPASANSHDVTAGSAEISDAPSKGSSKDDLVRFDGAGQSQESTTAPATPTSSIQPSATSEVLPASSDTSPLKDPVGWGVRPIVVVGVGVLITSVAVGGVILAHRRRA